MADIARRSFLFGMGAALTTAALARPMALLMPTPLPFKVRRIADFTVGLDTEADRPAFFSIRIGERGIASGGIGPGGCYRWAAPYREDWIFQRAEEVFHVDLGGDLAEAQFISYNESGVGIVETHKPGKPATFRYLEAGHG
jgi:hypothetical protein